MNKYVLGIDLGTSSVKLLRLYEDGRIVKHKESYGEISPAGWWKAICSGFTQIDWQEVIAIGLSSQVGTYIINDNDVISWNEGAGLEELKEIKETYGKKLFIEEISMPHPDINSYPIPRIKYICKNYTDIKSICQPKDYICEKLTGNRVTDIYSWRGLANLTTGKYSDFFLGVLGIKEECLPKLISYKEKAGVTDGTEVAKGIPVYAGLNDYYAGLLGMGLFNQGSMFDISGTSEHLGILEEEMAEDTPLVSGPYLVHNIHYGVTASSGVSLKYALYLAEKKEIDIQKSLKRKAPIFLPYLKGERAPIWNPEARGTFFGIEEDCTKEDMAYSVMEGVVFSLYHIYETMGKPEALRLTVTGGAAVSPVLNRLKAEMLGVPVAVGEETDTSALGAAMIAAVGEKWYENLQTASKRICRIKETIEPTGKYKEVLHKRYEIYRELYPALQTSYEKLKEINQ